MACYSVKEWCLGNLFPGSTNEVHQKICDFLCLRVCVLELGDKPYLSRHYCQIISATITIYIKKQHHRTVNLHFLLIQNGRRPSSSQLETAASCIHSPFTVEIVLCVGAHAHSTNAIRSISLCHYWACQKHTDYRSVRGISVYIHGIIVQPLFPALI